MDDPCSTCNSEIEASTRISCGLCKLSFHPRCVPAGSSYTDDGTLVCCLSKKKGTKRSADKALAPPRLLRSKSSSSAQPDQASTDQVPAYFQTFLEIQRKQNLEVNAKLDKVLTLNAEVTEIKKAVTSIQTEMSSHKSDRAKSAYEIRSCDLIISGLPEQVSEDLDDILKKIAECLSVAMLDRDIISIDRIQSRYNEESSTNGLTEESTSSSAPQLSAAPQPRANKPRTIIARLSNPGLRNKFIRAMRVRKNLNSSSIVPGTTARVFINEHLPFETLDLLKKARLLVRDHPEKFVYTNQGVIHYRPARGSPAVEISSEKDLENIYK